MSILIKGMEIPTSCGYCPLMHGTPKGDECYVGAHITEYQKIPDDCPIVPIPPHGDLIDRDALLRGDGRYIIAFGREGIDVSEIKNARTVIPPSGGQEDE